MSIGDKSVARTLLPRNSPGVALSGRWHLRDGNFSQNAEYARAHGLCYARCSSRIKSALRETDRLGKPCWSWHRQASQAVATGETGHAGGASRRSTDHLSGFASQHRPEYPGTVADQGTRL